MAEEAIALLRSIDASLKQLVAQQRVSQPKPIATDRDLDGKYGNPILKFLPRDWTGESFKGRRFSECPAPLLEMVAEMFDYFGDQAEAKNERANNGQPAAKYKRADAARARGWAKRVRDGHVQPAAAAARDEEAEGWGDDPTAEAEQDGWS